MTNIEKNQTQHTPGPWSILPIDNGFRIRADKYGKGFNYVASVLSAQYWAKEHEANARLIAVAPDLLSIAKVAVFIFGNEANYPEGTIGFDLAKEAKETIAKATGKKEEAI